MENKSLKSGFGIGMLIFVAAAVITLPVRTIQYFTVLESETGFFRETNWSVILLYAILTAATAFCLVFGFIRRKKLEYSFESMKRPGFGILSLTAALGILADGINCILSVMNTQTILTPEGKLQPIVFISGLEAVFSLFSAIYLLAVGAGALSGKNNGSEYKLLSLAPVLWSMFRLIFRFTRTISYIRVSDLMFEMLTAAFLILFFMAFAQVNSGVNGKGCEWKIAAYGLPAALFALLCFVPRFIVTVTGNANLLHEQSPVEYCDFAAALFIISTVFTRVTDKIPETRSEE